MDDIERHNLNEIEGLNQRGGRTLSFVDLVRAGTMSEEMVAHCWTAIAHGASFLTAARPGGAGKSTVLANLLALLPPGEQIATWSRDADEPPGATCWLAHEMGAGRWYGYIWADEVPEFLGLRSAGHRVASCLHADTLEETHHTLFRPPLHVTPESLNGIGLILFIHIMPGQQRRVALLHEATEEGHRLAFALDGAGAITRQGPSRLLPLLGTGEAEYARRLEDVREIMRAGEADFAAVRAAILAQYNL
jgi:hypothetical protein